MPIFEYRCKACGEEMDYFHRSRNEPKPVCQKCGEDALERLISLSSFQLKGGGWYVSDYKGKNSSSSSDANGHSVSSNSSDSSPEATPKAEKAQSTAASEQNKGSKAKKGVEAA